MKVSAYVRCQKSSLWGRVLRIGKQCGALVGAGLLVVGLSPAVGAGEAPLCFGEPATIVGTDSFDTLTGTPGPDVIHGKGGHDFIDGLGGNDRICGGQSPAGRRLRGTPRGSW